MRAFGIKSWMQMIQPLKGAAEKGRLHGSSHIHDGKLHPNSSIGLRSGDWGGQGTHCRGEETSAR